MKSFSATDASKSFGKLLKEAEVAPVEIKRHRRGGRRYVLMSAQVFEVYERIRAVHSHQRVLAALKGSIGKIVAGDTKGGFELMDIGNSLLNRWLDAMEEKL